METGKQDISEKWALPLSSFWNAVMAVVAVITAVTTFMWYFMVQAGELGDQADLLSRDQLELRQLTIQIADQVDANTAAIAANTKTLNQLATDVKFIQNGIHRLICLDDPDQPDCKRRDQ